MAAVPTLEDLRASSQFTEVTSTSDDGEGDASTSSGSTPLNINNGEASIIIQSLPGPNEALNRQQQDADDKTTKKRSFWFRSPTIANTARTTDRSNRSTAAPSKSTVKMTGFSSYSAAAPATTSANTIQSSASNRIPKKLDAAPEIMGSDPRDSDAGHLKESYQQMLKMTLELVDDLYLNLRPGDSVLTVYGPGTLLKKESIQSDQVAGFLSTRGNTTKTKIQLSWGGILSCPRSDLIHKILSPQEYEQAMDHLEEIRKLQVTMQCQEWGIQPQSNEACVACLFHKPELYSSSRRGNSKRNYYWRSSSNASASSSDVAPAVTTKTKRCDVCGNPVCSQHKIAMGGGEVEFFNMCVDCSHDLNQTEHTLHAHHPQLLQTLQRLVQYYTRMSLQLSFCVPNLNELANQLTHKQKRDGAISLGNSALGFVGAALGVAGAAAMLTPAGPAILLAAVATSATSGTFQGMHLSYNKFISNKTAHQLADRCLGWHGLCLGILNAMEVLRQDLIVQEYDFEVENGSPRSPRGVANTGGVNPHSEIWNTLAVGSFATTRNAMTGLGVTSAMGASYSQAINTTMQGIPVVGAAFAVGCMAMDANNMASSFKMLNTPAKKEIALHGVSQSFIRHVLTTISPNVDMILEGVDDLQRRIHLVQEEEERRLIEEELEGLGGGGGGGGDYVDDDLERELAGL
jgi:hypothetical protein